MSEHRTFRVAGLFLTLCLLQLANAASYSCACGTTTRQTTTSCGFFGWSRCGKTVTATKICQCVDGGWSDDEWQTSACSVTCGGGSRTVSRSRTCSNPTPANGGKGCVGSATESTTESCNTQQCPVNGGWTEYQETRSPCSVSCGGGELTLTRTRTCTNPPPSNGGILCVGVSSATMKETCNSDPCPIDGGWTEYEETRGPCSVSCGGGELTLTKTRTCTNPPPSYGGNFCVGAPSATMKETCNSDPCPIDGGWTEYEETRGPCSVSCGGGELTLTKTRTCTNPPPSYGGNFCVGAPSATMKETCNSDPCPIDGGWTEYEETRGPCSVSCGGGELTVTKTRTCTKPPPSYGGNFCVGAPSATMKETCNSDPCPIDGGWTEYEETRGPCSVSCGGGELTLTKTRTCTNPSPSNGGNFCVGAPSTTMKETCNSDPCPIDGGWTEYEETWGPCSVSCGGGELTLTKTRTCTNPAPSYGGKFCVGAPSATMKETCNSDPCPIDGGWTEYEETRGPCSVSCGGGELTLTKTRTCTNPPPSNGGNFCVGAPSATMKETCNSDPCPIDGAWCAFNELTWTQCSEHCDKTGTQTRVCACPPAQYGGTPCDGSNTNTETMDCYEGTCLAKTCEASGKPSSSLPRNCEEYVRCDTNTVPIVMPCPPGLHFDDDKGVCVQGDCGVIADDEVAPICNSDNNGAFVGDEEDCTAYYQCSNEIAVPMSCAPGTIWDQSMTACVFGDCNVVEVVDDEEVEVTACANSDTGTLLPDPDDCRKYIQCVNKQDIPMACSIPLVFDRNLSFCNWESNTNPCITKP